MSFTKRLVYTLCIVALATGCPLEEDTNVDGGTASAEGDGGRTGDTSIDAAEPAASMQKDDQPTQSGLDAGGDDQGMDAGTKPNDEDGAVVADAGGMDPMAPDLGAAELADADRAKLIFDLIKSEGYEQNWYPFMEETSSIRPLIVAPSHGSAVRVFQNAVAKKATDDWLAKELPIPLTMPNGSIIVKQTFKVAAADAGPDEYVPSGLVVMAKVDALDGTKYEGKWFYMRVSTADEPSYASTCVNCHNGRTQKSIWPPDPNVVGDKGGMADGVVPYDYLFGLYCHDPRTPQCSSPH